MIDDIPQGLDQTLVMARKSATIVRRCKASGSRIAYTTGK
jgi:hypothetical protein